MDLRDEKIKAMQKEIDHLKTTINVLKLQLSTQDERIISRINSTRNTALTQRPTTKYFDVKRNPFRAL